MTLNRHTLAFAAVLVGLLAMPAEAQDSSRAVRLGLTYTGGRPPGVAVLSVPGTNGDSVRAMLQRDLENGDRVTIIGRSADDLPLVDGVPNYDLFATLGAAYIVQASVQANGELHVALLQVAEKRPTQARNFALTPPVLGAEWRMSVHRAADSVEMWATGVPGISATRVAFVRDNRIWTVDSDGGNAVAVDGTVDGRSPAWHPSGRYLAFSTLAGVDNSGGITIRDLFAGNARRVTPTQRDGTFSSPTFSPDGTQLAYTFGEDGADIFIIDPFKGGASKRITTGRTGAINTQPSFSPDGRQIVFSSGRGRNPELYISDVDGSNVRLLTDDGFGDSFGRTNPSWSLDNRAIAYQSQNDGRFQIMTIAPNGKNVVTLTGDSVNEDPYWAPDGRHLVFQSARGGTTQLWVLDTESGRVRQLTFGRSKASYASWSPMLSAR